MDSDKVLCYGVVVCQVLGEHIMNSNLLTKFATVK